MVLANSGGREMPRDCGIAQAQTGYQPHALAQAGAITAKNMKHPISKLITEKWNRPAQGPTAAPRHSVSVRELKRRLLLWRFASRPHRPRTIDGSFPINTGTEFSIATVC